MYALQIQSRVFLIQFSPQQEVSIFKEVAFFGK